MCSSINYVEMQHVSKKTSLIINLILIKHPSKCIYINTCISNSKQSQVYIYPKLNFPVEQWRRTGLYFQFNDIIFSYFCMKYIKKVTNVTCVSKNIFVQTCLWVPNGEIDKLLDRLILLKIYMNSFYLFFVQLDDVKVTNRRC